MTNSDDVVLYLSELMQDRERLSQTPGRFKHVERLVDQGQFLLFVGGNISCSVDIRDILEAKFSSISIRRQFDWGGRVLGK